MVECKEKTYDIYLEIELEGIDSSITKNIQQFLIEEDYIDKDSINDVLIIPGSESFTIEKGEGCYEASFIVCKNHLTSRFLDGGFSADLRHRNVNRIEIISITIWVN